MARPTQEEMGRIIDPLLMACVERLQRVRSVTADLPETAGIIKDWEDDVAVIKARFVEHGWTWEEWDAETDKVIDEMMKEWMHGANNPG